MKTKLGFIPSGSQREKTPYDQFNGDLVRIDIAGGVGLAGKLESCEIHNSGYMFSLNPSIIYRPNGEPRISKRKSILESNGNALSIIELGYDIKDYVSEIKKAIEKKNSK